MGQNIHAEERLMNGEDATAPLVRGVRNIQRMREEIELVIKTVTSLAPLREWAMSPKEKNLSFYPERTRGWEFWNRGVMGNWGLHYCNEAIDFVVTFSDNREVRPFPLEYVSDAHQDLSALIAGIARVFPEIKNKLQIFYDAA